MKKHYYDPSWMRGEEIIRIFGLKWGVVKFPSPNRIRPFLHPKLHLLLLSAPQRYLPRMFQETFPDLFCLDQGRLVTSLVECPELRDLTSELQEIQPVKGLPPLMKQSEAKEMLEELTLEQWLHDLRESHNSLLNRQGA